MPKQVDHEQRRKQIAEALLRLAGRGGMEAVNLRDVAAEAGISMGSVQHYFRTKEQMLQYAAGYVNDRAAERIRARIEATDEPHSARTVVRAVLVEMLALSTESRQEYLVTIAFFVRALAEPDLAALYREWWPQLEQWITDLLRGAQEAGEIAAGVDVWMEARILLAVPDGLSIGLLLGHHGEADSVAMIDHALDRVFAC
ncbi:TetR/AcrR family transcriptional regulator [Saccharopolyspora gloriosae]|uniref:TetR/AcrR family transcriptional regulator n=1 Tax=Saccharopolyspora gloriosae TaxID=455344 RepID=UPI001FB7C8C1|nr:TetR family transcriptional regulator C-terminal domain-containing protein [Saccharopolyspora gloriosae]